MFLRLIVNQLILIFIIMLVSHHVSLRIDGPKQLIVLVLDGEIDYLSPDDHQEDQVLEDVHEVILGASVILG